MHLLQALFTGKPAGHKILVWSLKSKCSHWFENVEEIDAKNYDSDVYFGVGTSPEDFGPRKRCPAAKITGIGALWLDIDIAGPAHKKGNLPATEAEATKLLADTFQELEPSYIIDSGHGLQAYWLLDSWCEITEANRSEVQALSIDFNALWRAHCAEAGYDADSVCDLARVMRLPGSKNHKVPSDVKPVVELKATEIRYSFAQLRAWVTEHYKVPSGRVHSTESPKPAAKPTRVKDKPGAVDPEKWEALCLADKRVQLTWDMKREDMAGQSVSEYTMAIGRFAHNAGWSDQEVYDLMYAFRVFHKSDPKPHALKITLNNIKRSPSGFAQDAPGETVSLAELSEKIGVEIAKITRFDTTPPAYVLTLTDNRTVHLGTIEGITELKKFRNTIAAAIGILPNKFKPDAWDAVVKKLLTYVEHDSAGAEATEEGQCIEWIQGYLHAVTIHKDRADGLTTGEPWEEDGQVHVFGTALRAWVAFNLQDRVDSRRLGLVLRSIGAEPISITNGDGRRAAWKLPRKIWEVK